MIREQGAIDVTPSKSTRKIPKEFDKELYWQRNKIWRFLCRLKASFHRIATQYEQSSRKRPRDDQITISAALVVYEYATLPIQSTAIRALVLRIMYKVELRKHRLFARRSRFCTWIEMTFS